MSRYKAYPEYKKSGVDNLDEIPSTWEVMQLKRSVLDCVNGIWGNEPENDGNDTIVIRVADFDRPKLSIVDEGFTYRKIEQKEKRSRLLKCGDLLLEKSGGGEKTLVGQVVLFDKDFAAVTSNFVAKMTPHPRSSGSYLNYVFSHFYSGNINYCSIKQNTGIQNLDSASYLSEKFGFPSLPEQEKIAAFLDHETAKIDALIEKQQRLLELLKEKRLSLVHYATKEAPEVRLENCARLISRPISNCTEELFTPIGIYNRGRGIFHKDESLPCDLGDSDFFYVKENDLIFSGQFAWEGAVALADSNDDGCIASHRYPILTGIDNLLSTSYLWAFFTSKRGDFLLGENSRGAAGRNRPLNMNSLMKEKIPLPNFEDQLAVSKVVYQERVISERVATVIATLQERRTALISAAVTGKIDVRDWQAPA